MKPALERRPWQLLAFAAVGPWLLAEFLHALNVPLGCPGRFVYLYSPFVAVHLRMVPAAVLIGLALGWATWLAAASAARRRMAGLGLAALASTVLGVWAFVAPPYYLSQHFFNAHSPSQDGAFVVEALRVSSVGDYLRAFPERARTPPAQMRGTRVISNPPAATLLAVGLERVLERWPALRERISRPFADAAPGPDVVRSAALGVLFFMVLTGLWVLAGVFLYGIGRLFLPPAPSVAYAVCCTFSPMTLLFTPGKDPAQLLTVAVPLYLWLWAYRHNRLWTAALAGIAFVSSTLASLVHLWIAVLVVVATLLSARSSSRELRRVLLRMVCPAVGGALIAATGLYVAAGLDWTATVRAVAQSQAAVTRGPDAMPLAWQLLGLPLFLLFAGPALWTVALWTAWPPAPDGGAAVQTRPPRDAGASFGLYLLVGSAVVMLATLGFTNLETPRLWIPFVPLLLLGGLLQVPGFRSPGRRTVLLLAALVCVQIVASALHWSLMDMRETETRLLEQRFFH